MKPSRTSLLTALGILALLLFSPPLLLLYDREGPWGFSALSLVIYPLWGLVIVLAALVLEGRDEK
ncbi:hypothetical protein ACQUQP_14170 [Marinobacterium sp. YM272]|uniref:hypothetical protein n=1 Tax=Marinobacterium sp. YM272 TaxID=3421654 RepID=UPI003D7FEAFE